MAKTFNKEALSRIGESLVDARKEAEMGIEDINQITRMHYLTIKAMESGGNTTMDNFISYCFALNKQPSEIIPPDLLIKPKGRLSPARLEKSRITMRINKLFRQDFFARDKYSRDVSEILRLEYDLDASTNLVSVILSRLVAEGKLKATKEDFRNRYVNAGKKKGGKGEKRRKD